MVQHVDRCKKEISARLMVQDEKTNKTLTAFTQILCEICQGDDISEDAILNSTPFTLQYANNIIVNISRN